MYIFEAIMLFCFGISWPISISKSIRTKKVTGKSPTFMIIVIIGYICGIINKLLNNSDWIISLYAINIFMVSIDLFLYYKYIPKDTTNMKIKA